MKKDPRYAFLHAFFLICPSSPFQNLLIWPKTHPFFQFCTFLHLNDVRAHIAWSWKTTQYVNFLRGLISYFKYKWPPSANDKCMVLSRQTASLILIEIEGHSYSVHPWITKTKICEVVILGCRIWHFDDTSHLFSLIMMIKKQQLQQQANSFANQAWIYILYKIWTCIFTGHQPWHYIRGTTIILNTKDGHMNVWVFYCIMGCWE